MFGLNCHLRSSSLYIEPGKQDSMDTRTYCLCNCRDRLQRVNRGGRVVRRCWVNFQCRGVLRTWITVGQGPIVLALGAGGGCLDIISLIYHFSSLSPSLWETQCWKLRKISWWPKIKCLGHKSFYFSGPNVILVAKVTERSEGPTERSEGVC